MPPKLPKLPHIKYVRSRGRVYAYFNTGQKRDGKAIYVPLPPPSAPGFFARYDALKGARTKRLTPAYTVADFVKDFLDSPHIAERAEATQKLYGYQLDKLTALVGKHALDRIEARHIREIVETAAWGAGTKNAFLSAVGALYAWGRRRGKTELRPVEDIERFEMGQHDPWPEDVLEAALKADNDRVRLAVHILYFTGLRIGDACRLRWGAIRDGVLTITPKKTKRFRKTLEITLASELRAELERTPKRGLTVLTDAKGQPLTIDTLREELKAFTRALGVETVPHGLRKNAVNALLEAGCTVAEVQSITGQSLQVIEHYAARVNNRKLGQAAIVKLEGRRKAK